MRELRRRFECAIHPHNYPPTQNSGGSTKQAWVIARLFGAEQSYTLGRMNVSTYVYATGLRSLFSIIIIVVSTLTIVATSAVGQQISTETELPPISSGPPPSPQERLLSPVPQQFDWIQREVRPNPLLETLVGLEGEAPRLFMWLTLAEQYSDNFLQSDGSEMTEYRSMVDIGTVFRLESGRSFVSLANTVNANYDARSEDSNVGFANLSLNAGHELPRLSLALSESFIRHDEAGQADPSGVRRGRRTFLRNRVSPQVRYAFSRLTSMTLSYTNTLVRSDGGVIGDDSTTHSATIGLQQRFSRLVTGSVTYTFTDDNTEGVGTADSQTHSASGELGYAITRLTSLVLNASGSTTDRSGGGEDSQSYGASIGLRRRLTTFLGAFISLGVTVFDTERDDPEAHLSWQANLDGVLPFSRRTSLTLNTSQNVEDTVGRVDAVGIVLTRSITLTLNHAFSRFLQSSLFLNYTRTEQLEDPIGTSEAVSRREDNFWQTGGRATYALSRIFSLSVVYLYQRRNSNLAGADFDENQVIITLSSGVSIL